MNSKKIITIILILLAIPLSYSLLGCKKRAPEQKFSYTIKITFTNGDIDTVKTVISTFKQRPISLQIKNSRAVLFGDPIATNPCLTARTFNRNFNLACDVRLFSVLSIEEL